MLQRLAEPESGIDDEMSGRDAGRGALVDAPAEEGHDLAEDVGVARVALHDAG